MDNHLLPAKQTPSPVSRPMWTLSYRLHGLAIALAISSAYCYFYLHYWHKWLLISSIIFGYFLGWAIGNFYFRKS